MRLKGAAAAGARLAPYQVGLPHTPTRPTGPSPQRARQVTTLLAEPPRLPLGVRDFGPFTGPVSTPMCPKQG
jgi:hypothetical protein